VSAKFVRPCIPTTAKAIPRGAWLHEPTLDGYRFQIVKDERIVFDIKGGGYRLVVAVDFEKSIVWIKWLGTHKDYDKIDVAEVKYAR
jgi:mRNA-degrading endonuclease HigB of HigAB toxin-antitoxin module